MITRQLKAIYFATMQWPMRLSAFAYKTWRSPASGNHDTVKVHLGPGQDRYKPGWINVDANAISARIDVWADLRRALPFRDGSVDAIYSHHFIEHLPDALLPFHFREMHRCLKPGGVVRIGGPNGDEAFRNYIAGNEDWFELYRDFPVERSSMGGRLVNLLICNGEHLTILTRSYLGELLGQAGFTNITFRLPVTETGHPHLMTDALSGEWEPNPESPYTLIAEAVRPA